MLPDPPALLPSPHRTRLLSRPRIARRVADREAKFFRVVFLREQGERRRLSVRVLARRLAAALAARHTKSLPSSVPLPTPLGPQMTTGRFDGVGSDAKAVTDRNGRIQFGPLSPGERSPARMLVLLCDDSVSVIPRHNPAAPTKPELRPSTRAENFACRAWTMPSDENKR